MSEELYNSSDYCSLAEQYEELKKENAELARDKDYLMNLFMERSEYVFNVVANMKIESLTQKCKALEADYEVSNREMLIIQVEIGRLKSELARRDEIIARLKEDGERFDKRAITYVYLEDTPPYYECELCFHDADEPDNILHDKSCPITLHRALMKELEEK